MMSQSPGHSAHYMLRSGELDIDPVCRVLRRDGNMVSASPKAFELIYHLARNNQRAVSKDELAEVVWSGVTVADTSLRWLLKEVRRCLGDNGATQRYIQTVRGYGLRWGQGVTLITCDRTAFQTSLQHQGPAVRTQHSAP